MLTATIDEKLADPFLPELYRVVRTTPEIPDVVTIDIAPVSGVRPPFTAGQFNMLYVFGVGEMAISMSGDPADMSGHVHTISDVGAVSGALKRLEEGAIIGVRGPYGMGGRLQRRKARTWSSWPAAWVSPRSALPFTASWPIAAFTAASPSSLAAATQ